jgi:hypothetical protein
VPDSPVTYELYGRIDDRQQKQLERDKAKFEAKKLREAMAVQAQSNAQNAAAGNNGGPPSGSASPRRRATDSAVP